MTPQQALQALAQGKTLQLHTEPSKVELDLTLDEAVGYIQQGRSYLLRLKPESKPESKPYIVTISGLTYSGKTRALLSMAGSYDEIFSVKGVLAYLKRGQHLDTLYVDEANKEDLEKIKLASVGSSVKRIYVAGENL